MKMQCQVELEGTVAGTMVYFDLFWFAQKEVKRYRGTM